MFTTKKIRGTESPITGRVGPAPIELALAAKHCTAGADFCKEHGDGTYILTFPSAADYRDFLKELATCCEVKAVISDALIRHEAWS
jgi:hypothetical protein